LNATSKIVINHFGGLMYIEYIFFTEATASVASMEATPLHNVVSSTPRHMRDSNSQR